MSQWVITSVFLSVVVWLVTPAPPFFSLIISPPQRLDKNPACVRLHTGTCPQTLWKLTLRPEKQCLPPSYFHKLKVIDGSVPPLHPRPRLFPNPLPLLFPPVDRSTTRRQTGGLQENVLVCVSPPLWFCLNFLRSRKRPSALVRPPCPSCSSLLVTTHFFLVFCVELMIVVLVFQDAYIYAHKCS